MSPEETLDVEGAVERLNAALELQYRSALSYTLFAGSIFGLEYQGLGEQLWAFAQEELADARHLIEKLGALGGEPTTSVAEPRWTRDAQEWVKWLIDTETEAIEAMQAAIEPTGREGRSEALEHLLEHIILRKQNQVDFLIRARGG
jgi:bacterioferritin (cytochrome b1)